MFDSAQWLWLLLGVFALAAVYVVLQLRRRRYVARFSNAGLLASIAPKRPGWRRHLTFAMLLLALTVLSVGVARPTAAVRVPREEATVMLALDVSLSMQATDVLPTRIDAAKKAAIKFADLLPPKINIGLVAFAKSAEVKVPPTIDRDSFKASVNSLELRESTAIGDAVEACLDAIRTFSASTTANGSKPPPAQIVLLSDGTSNSGKKPLDAAQDAVKQKVPVATIAFGTPSGTVDLPGEGVQPVPADRTTLHRLADATHGSFHTAVSEQEALRDLQGPRLADRLPDRPPRHQLALPGAGCPHRHGGRGHVAALGGPAGLGSVRHRRRRVPASDVIGAGQMHPCVQLGQSSGRRHEVADRGPAVVALEEQRQVPEERVDLLVLIAQHVLRAQRLGPVVHAPAVQRAVEVLDGEQSRRGVEHERDGRDLRPLPAARVGVGRPARSGAVRRAQAAARPVATRGRTGGAPEAPSPLSRR
jgi:Ca-activated chloride channel family protein